MFGLQAQVQYVERAVAELLRKLSDLTARVLKLEQNPWNTGAGGGGGVVSQAFYVAYPAAGVGGATWTSGVPTSGVSFTAPVWQVSFTGSATGLGNQTCLNWLPAPVAGGKAVIVMPDGAGNYVVTGQSCA